MDLIEFLRARLDEDERVARAAIGTAAFAKQTGEWSFEWVDHPHGKIPTVFAVADTGVKTQAASMETAWECQERGAHIARHDPARVLREVEALRRIVDEHHPVDPCDAHDASFRSISCDTLRALAAIWADHEDYRAEWQPV